MLQIFSLATALMVAGSLLNLHVFNTGHFLLVNNASEPIAYASVSICGQTVQLWDVLPNKSADGSYRVTSDSHYTIRVEFRSGGRLEREIGYVTSGMDFNDRIIVTDSDIELMVVEKS